MRLESYCDVQDRKLHFVLSFFVESHITITDNGKYTQRGEMDRKPWDKNTEKPRKQKST